jgi:hypothetical protein
MPVALAENTSYFMIMNWIKRHLIRVYITILYIYMIIPIFLAVWSPMVMPIIVALQTLMVIPILMAKKSFLAMLIIMAV